MPEKLGINVDSCEEITDLASDWLDSALENLNPLLPQKFYVTGHCGGCNLALIWATKNTHRIEKLFLCEPGGILNPPANFDPWKGRTNDESIAPNKKQLIKTFYPDGSRYAALKAFL